MKGLLRLLFCFTLFSLPALADHNPDIKSMGKYPQPYVATTRAGWTSINWNAGGSQAMPAGFPGLANDFSNIMSLCGSGIFYTRPGWGGWYYSYQYSSNIINVPDNYAGGLCSDDSDMVTTALTSDGRPFVAYLRHGWTTVHLAGFAGVNLATSPGLPVIPQQYSAHSSLLSNITDQYTNHMGIYFNYMGSPGVWVAVWRDSWNQAIWIPVGQGTDSTSELGFWGNIPN